MGLKLAPAQRVRDYYHRNQLSGGPLRVPRTPAQRILLRAKLLRLKREAQDRGR